MANTLTDLAADIYKAADIVGREVQGFIPSVTVNAGSEAAAQGDTVRAAFTREATVNSSATPAMTIPEGDDQTIDNKTVTVDQIASVRIPWTGEDIKSVNNGAGFETIYGDQLRQAFRGITNAIEAHVASEVYKNASRAVGTAGTTPFASNHDVINEARQIVLDNGMPVNDGRLSLVMNSAAGTNLRNLSNLYKVNEMGSDQLLRQGTLLDISGVMLKESGQVQSHTKGTGTSYDVDLGAGYSVGDTTVHVDTGTGTILAGDVVTFSGDTSYGYVVNTGFAGDGDGDIVIGGPGLQAAVADGEDLVIGNNYTANALIHQSAVELVMRPLEKPLGGDAAEDVMVVQDPFSGLVFQISVYKGYNKAMIDVTCLYKAKVWKSDGVALVMG